MESHNKKKDVWIVRDGESPYIHIVSANEMQETQSREKEGNRFHEKYITAPSAELQPCGVGEMASDLLFPFPKLTGIMCSRCCLSRAIPLPPL